MQKLVIDSTTGELQIIDLTQAEMALLTPTLAQVQQNKIAQMQQAYESQLAAGFTSTASGTAQIYDYGAISQQALAELFLAYQGNTLPDAVYPIPILLENGTNQPLTKAQLPQLMTDLTVWKLPLGLKLNTLTSAKGTIMSATTIDAVNAIVW